MIYRAYRIVRGYTSERIRKDISDFNKSYPYSFIFDNFFDTYESIEVKGFETADDVLRFEDTEGFICWENFNYPVVHKRLIENSNDIVYVFHHDASDGAYNNISSLEEGKEKLNAVFTFHEFVEQYPEISLISFTEYMQKCAEVAPTSDMFLSDIELVDAMNKSLDEFDTDLALYNITYDITDKETMFLKFEEENPIINFNEYIVVLEDGRIVTGPYNACRLVKDDIHYAKKWRTLEDDSIINFMYAFFEGKKYQVYPIITTTQFKLS